MCWPQFIFSNTSCGAAPRYFSNATSCFPASLLPNSPIVATMTFPAVHRVVIPKVMYADRLDFPRLIRVRSPARRMIAVPHSVRIALLSPGKDGHVHAPCSRPS